MRDLPWLWLSARGERGGTFTREGRTPPPDTSGAAVAQAGPAQAGLAQAGPAEDGPAEDGILVANLLLTGEEVVRHLQTALRTASWLDAFLLAAGLSQLVEDRLHPDPWSLRRAAAYFSKASGRGRAQRWAVGSAAGLASAAAAGASRARLAGADSRALRTYQPEAASLVGRLASHVMNGTAVELDQGAVMALASQIADHLGRDVTRLPASFRDFDQHPADVEWLVRRYSASRPDRDQPLAVVGVRTSGCYLGPLATAALRAAGYPRLSTLTLRPGRPLGRDERAALLAVVRAGGRVLVVDDPPGEGTAYAAACRALERAGVPASSITLLISLLGEADGLPPRLSSWERIVQPWSEWSVHDRLKPDAVKWTLAELLPSRPPLAGIRLLVPAEPRRGHTQAEYVVSFVDEAGGGSVERRVVVEGAGLGYLGRQALAVARGLKGFVPHVYGVRGGLLYREGVSPGSPDPGSPDPETEDVVAAVVGYALARREALSVEQDVSARLAGRDPVWEVAAAFLARAYGPLAPLARTLLLEPLSRRLLASARACVVDGDNDLGGWVVDAAHDGALRKVNFHQRAFSHRELTCYDAVFDLAGAALPPVSPAVGARVRAGYLARCGEVVDRERWLLYQLTQLRELSRFDGESGDSIARRQARAVNEYLAAMFLSDATLTDDGPLCAIDLDGVLETDPFGIRATTAAGVLALRGLIRHGYRPVLATGRSLPEVIERCELFGLAGGVAEYGSVLYQRSAQACVDLRSESSRVGLDLVRDHLRGLPGVRTDEGYRYALRVQSLDASGRYGPLTYRQTAGLFDAAGGLPVTVIRGECQTDVIGAGVGKGMGLLALSRRLQRPVPSPPGGFPYALAVGDSEPDVEMFAIAALARAPLNSSAAVRAAGIPIVRHAYQSGLADACAALLGHRPGGCPQCRPPQLLDRTQALVSALSLRESGVGGTAAKTVRLVAATARVVTHQAGAGR